MSGESLIGITWVRTSGSYSEEVFNWVFSGREEVLLSMTQERLELGLFVTRVTNSCPRRQSNGPNPRTRRMTDALEFVQ